MNLESSIRELGAKLYAELSAINTLPVVEGSAQAKRRDRLELANRWNALALSGLRSH